MLDALLRPMVDPALNTFAASMKDKGITANRLTLVGFALGMMGCFMAGFALYSLAIIFILLSRACDLLDGPLARAQSTASVWGGYLDITCDFVVFAAFPALFIIGQPHHALAAAFLLFSYMGTATTFLAFGIAAAKQNLNTDDLGNKSFFHQGGLIGATETVLFMVVCCLYPDAFSALAVIFGMACWITAVQRFLQAWRTLG